MILLFESRVVLDGSQTSGFPFASSITFESRVVLDGSQTENGSVDIWKQFESRVVLDGSQDVYKRQIYDWSRLETMLDGEKYLSFAKVKTYQKHESDLKRLKMVLKEHADSKLYREIFHTAGKKLDNYPAYAGKGAANYRCDYDQFRKYLTGKLHSLRDSVPQIDEILEELECGTFLPRPTSKNNGIIPHQLHEMELVRILENAQKYLPFLQPVSYTHLLGRMVVLSHGSEIPMISQIHSHMSHILLSCGVVA